MSDPTIAEYRDATALRFKRIMGVILVLLAFGWDAVYALWGGWQWMYFCGAFMGVGIWQIIAASTIGRRR